MMSDDTMGLGWLPVGAREDLETTKERASAEETERLLALDARARLLELMERLAGEADPAAVKLRPADLARLVESFDGAAAVEPEELAIRFPALVDEG
jgi:hypothetical protein